MDATDIVFVYGTLRRDQSNHALLADARFLGRHTTEALFTMWDLGWYPGVTAGGQTAIEGELYSIGSELLVLLDELEDYPELYDRTRIATAFGEAWIYLYRAQTHRRPMIGSGDWLRRS